MVGLDVLTKAIDFIYKVVADAHNRNTASRVRYFTEVVKPLFESVDTIHDFYIALILETHHKLLGSPISNVPKSDDDRATILKEFLKCREKDERLRFLLRSDAHILLAEVKQTEERDFLVLLCYYFLSRRVIVDSWWLEMEAEALASEGGNKHWDSPTLELYSRLAKAKSSEEQAQILEDARTVLNHCYMNLRLAYNKLKAVVMQA